MDRLTARDPGFAAAVRARVRGEGREAEPLGRYSTYRIGGPATILFPATPEDVSEALAVAHEVGVPAFALGLGSNILLPDEGLEPLVIGWAKAWIESSAATSSGHSEQGYRPRSPP